MARARPTYFVNLGAEAVSASTPYVLVDLSDTTNFPHIKTQELHLMSLKLNSEKASDGRYDIWVGVVTENDATDGTAEWCHVFHLEADGNPTDGTDRFVQDLDFTLDGTIDGLNLNVTSGATPYFAGNQTQAGHANWQDDTNRTSPVRPGTKPGVGDIVVWVEEVSGTGTIDFSLTAAYEAL